MGLALLISAERVKADVPPSAGACSWAGELMISSREGIGSLLMGYQFDVHELERSDARILSFCTCTTARLCANFLTELIDLIDDELLHSLNRVLFLEAKVEFLDIG